MKATTTQLVQSYNQQKSVWKVANQFSMCGQSVYERLKKAGVTLKGQRYTEQECDKIRDLYSSGFKRGDSGIEELSAKIGRPVTSITRKAREMGLTSSDRRLSDTMIKKHTERMEKWHSENEHPKGMSGKTHSEEYKKECGVRLKNWWADASQEEKNRNRRQAITTKRANGNDNNHRGRWKASWRTIGGKRKFFRSRWEANYARYLQYLKEQKLIQDWLHEPETFWFESIKRGVRSYLPDFKIINNNNSHCWVEVKGWMDDKSKTKLKRFAKYYPKERMTVVDKKWFSANSSKMKFICPNWE